MNGKYQREITGRNILAKCAESVIVPCVTRMPVIIKDPDVVADVTLWDSTNAYCPIMAL